VTDWNTFALVGLGAMLLYLFSRAIFNAYFNAKEDFVNRLIEKHKRKGVKNGVQGKD